MKFPSICLLGAVTAAGLVFSASSALSQVTLEQLRDGSVTSVTSGDLVFSGFTDISGVGLAVDYGNIYVVPVSGGIEFQSADWSLNGVDLSYDLSLQFNVATTDGSSLAGIASQITGDNVGAGYASMTEGLTSGSTTLGTLGVYINTGGGNLIDSTDFSPVDTLTVNKDFSMTTDPDVGGFIAVSHFDQTFTTVPEPSSIALAVSGMAGLGLILRRRSA